LLEEIERADLQQSQTHTGSPAFTNYPPNDSTTPPRDHNIERVRATEKPSPNLEPRRQRDAVSTRESSIVRQPPSHSPSAFAQTQTSIPERRTSDSPARSSPLGGESSGETYTAYMTRDSPVHSSRRAPVNVLDSEPRAQYSVAAHTPPLQAAQGRPPARSLPVQEEPEDDPHLPIKDDPWKGLEHLDTRHRHASPTPSSDLYPEGHPQRAEAPHDDEVEEGAKTPRAPSVGLPDKNAHSMMGTIRVPARATGRVSSMDQLPLRGINETIYQPTPNNGVVGPSQSPNVHHFGQLPQQHRLTVDPNMSYHTYDGDYSSPYSGLYIPEEYYGYGDPSAPFYPDPQYDNRTRPDAPIPPTPHSQTAAPSPSPFPHARNGRNFAVPSPVHAASPYPAPFEHVRRNMISRNARHNVLDPHDPSFDINLFREQVAGQWAKYAQNTHGLGNMSDSTFSPSATPFQGNFMPWANLHARRTLGQFDLRSMQSSPGLDGPPVPPASVFRSRKKPQPRASKLSNEVPTQTLPPRVQSTQPRDTSPEPSTSGEETAGEDDFTAPNPSRTSWGDGSTGHVVEDDGDGDWVDEDEEADEDDLLELEYHPMFVKNVTKRRRRWETGWDSLLETVSLGTIS
jgi:hypothetical protein